MTETVEDMGSLDKAIKKTPSASEVERAGLVFGADDFYLPRSYISGFERHAPTLEVEFVPGCGHFLPEERPDLAAARLR